MGCGRTDTGVHAQNFFAHFDVASEQHPENLRFKLNSLLPNEIAIKTVLAVTSTAHARFDALSRTYRYFIHYSKDPFKKGISWYLYNKRLNVEIMNSLCEQLVGENDFSAFEKKGSDNENSICQVEFAKWTEFEEGLYFEIKSNRFLRNMVRAITGTLVDAGLGKISAKDFREVFLSKDRSNAGMSVPAEGLFLWDVQYPNSVFL